MGRFKKQQICKAKFGRICIENIYKQRYNKLL